MVALGLGETGIAVPSEFAVVERQCRISPASITNVQIARRKNGERWRGMSISCRMTVEGSSEFGSRHGSEIKHNGGFGGQKRTMHPNGENAVADANSCQSSIAGFGRMVALGLRGTGVGVPAEFAVVERQCRISPARITNVQIARRKNGERWRGMRICRRMTVEGSSEFGSRHGGEVKHNKGFGGQKRTMHPNGENAVVDANSCQSSIAGIISPQVSTVGKATNILWHECPVNKEERQKLIGQKGCVIWVTGLSGSGKSTLACALSHALHSRGKLTYLLDGDNVRHGLNKNLGFSAEDRAENIRRIGEVAKLFVDAGVICIASFISPYRKDRDACRALLRHGEFIEIFMNFSLQICEARDAKGLYKLARAGKIKGFTGIDDPYEPPESCELVIEPTNGVCPTPNHMAEKVVAYLEERGLLHS